MQVLIALLIVGFFLVLYEAVKMHRPKKDEFTAFVGGNHYFKNDEIDDAPGKFVPLKTENGGFLLVVDEVVTTPYQQKRKRKTRRIGYDGLCIVCGHKQRVYRKKEFGKYVWHYAGKVKENHRRCDLCGAIVIVPELILECEG